MCPYVYLCPECSKTRHFMTMNTTKAPYVYVWYIHVCRDQDCDIFKGKFTYNDYYIDVLVSLVSLSGGMAWDFRILLQVPPSIAHQDQAVPVVQKSLREFLS